MTKEAKQYISELLTIATETFPMHPAKPNITMNDSGNLVLSVIVKGMWYQWTFDEVDELSPRQVIDLFISEMRKHGVEI